MSRPHVRVDLRRELPFLLLVNTVIATLVTLLGEAEHFGFNLLVSNCIGFLMWGSTSLLCYALKVERVAFWHVLACMPLAVVLGFTLASSLWPGVVPERIAGSADLALQLRKFAMMALVTISAASLFYYRYNHQRNLTLLADAGRRQAELQQAETAARLALLQAQIEPHFLFNTLATLRSLIGSDPARATQALDLLNDYLRASLSRTRRREVTLAD
ncbi:MAG: histidine kinase, partial [Vogesella sp.]|nr:histidine kinase [Vogesella sp.]